MHTRIDPDFAALLGPRFQLEELERYPASVFGLWPDSAIAYVNPGWTAFANANGGQPDVARDWGVGARFLDAVAPALRPFYEHLLQSAPDAGTSLHPISHVYECSSAEFTRKFSMQVYSLPERAGFVIVNSLIFEAPHDPALRSPKSADRGQYLNQRGTIVQCCHCRLVQHADEPSRWDWVPAWVEQSPVEASHSLCVICFEYYYPQEAEEAEGEESA